MIFLPEKLFAITGGKMQKILVEKDGHESVKYDSPDSLTYIRKSKLSDYEECKIVPHRHEDLEIVMALSGEMLYTVGNKQYLLREKCAIAVNSMRWHSVEKSAADTDCEFIVVLINPGVICTTKQLENNYVLPLVSENAPDVFMLDNETEWQKDLISKLWEIYEAYAVHENMLQVTMLYFSIWQLLFFGGLPHKLRVLPPEPPTHKNGVRKAMKEMVMFIYDHYHEQIKLSDIAAAGNMCKSNCSEVFTRMLHDPPMKFLTNYRIYKSLKLLSETDESILNIAYKTGFSTSSYFTEVFKKYIGCTPTEYRKNPRVRRGDTCANPKSFALLPN